MNKALTAVLLHLSVSCAHPYGVCAPTQTGITLLGQGNGPTSKLPNNWTCERLIKEESRALSLFARHVTGDGRFHQSHDFQGWELIVEPTDPFIDAWGRRVSGYTACWQARIVVGGNVQGSSFAHELAHAIQNCSPNDTPGVDEDTDHAGWKAQGIQRAVDDWERLSYE